MRAAALEGSTGSSRIYNKVVPSSRQPMVTPSAKANGSGVRVNGSFKSNGARAHGGTTGHAPTRLNGALRTAGMTFRTGSKELPLRGHTERALQEYFASLNGHRPARLYDMVLHEVEEPLLRAVLDYAAGNQSRAAEILGINRGTLRKKLRVLGLSE